MHNTTIKKCIAQLSNKCSSYEIELMLSFVLKKDRVFIISHNDDVLTPEQISQITQMCQKRSRNVPLSYLLGAKELYSREFIVTKDTLVPRPETEILIDGVLSHISKNTPNNAFIVDIGTGSGIIPITLAKELDKKQYSHRILASDISSEALQIAKENAMRHDANITFFNSDLLQNAQLQNTIASLTKNDEIIITANLPYVDTAIKKDLLTNDESKSLAYEPPIALWSADNGLAHYKKLIEQTFQLRNILPNSIEITSFYEISPEQLSLLETYFDTNFSKQINDLNDLSGKARIIFWSC